MARIFSQPDYTQPVRESPEELHRRKVVPEKNLRRADDGVPDRLPLLDQDPAPLDTYTAFGIELHGSGIQLVLLHENPREIGRAHV